ncbi:MAG: NmrA family NAD(P)-binding protein [Myxococcales bacterium]|nr:NmrA family NAD(P)-binding protein [Myxococcales bacterium]
MTNEPREIIAVVGATGQQGGGVVQALEAQGRFRVRALTRSPDRYQGAADEVARADLRDPSSLEAAFAGAHGGFVVTNFWEGGGGKVDEVAQVTAAVQAAKAAGVQHLVWSSLPNVDEISGGQFHVPHFTDKARANAVVGDAGFAAWTIVEAPFYFQNLTGVMAPRPKGGGTRVWTLPMDPSVRCIHMADITELGKVVAGALVHPDQVGQGQILSLAAGRLSWDDVMATFRAQGHDVAYERVPYEVYASFFPGAEEMAQMLGYFEAHTYMGPDAEAKIARANAVATGPITDLATWLRANAAPAGA